MAGLDSRLDPVGYAGDDKDLIEAIKRNTSLAKAKLLNIAYAKDPELAEFIEKQYIPLLEADINTLTSASLDSKQYVNLVKKAFLIFYHQHVDLFIKRLKENKEDHSSYISPILFSAVSLYLALLYMPYVNGQQKKFILDILEKKRQMVFQGPR